MMKLARGYEHDLQSLEDIHQIEPFDLETLVSRFHETEVVGPRRGFAWALLDDDLGALEVEIAPFQ